MFDELTAISCRLTQIHQSACGGLCFLWLKEIGIPRQNGEYLFPQHHPPPPTPPLVYLLYLPRYSLPIPIYHVLSRSGSYGDIPKSIITFGLLTDVMCGNRFSAFDSSRYELTKSFSATFAFQALSPAVSPSSCLLAGEGHRLCSR
jgi:hypothetical protein